MRKLLTPAILALFLITSCTSVNETEDLRVAFYNVENLFDTVDDPSINDEEYLPDGRAKWDQEKYDHKINQLARVLSSIDTTALPGIIGLCEVENKGVLEDLTSHPKLIGGDYKIIHKNSPDFRGIDVALIYQNGTYKPIENEWMNVTFPFDERTTRDILYSKGMIMGGQTVHIFVNHWTSRWGGAAETEPKRIFIANLIKEKTDEILEDDPMAQIIIMGDLNDNPTDKSLMENLISEDLYNLSAPKFANGEGTLYYRSWDLFDQMIVSKSLIDEQGIDVLNKTHDIFKTDWLLFTDNKGNKRPNRTGSGGRYYGGFSDHLAVSLVLHKLN